MQRILQTTFGTEGNEPKSHRLKHTPTWWCQLSDSFARYQFAPPASVSQITLPLSYIATLTVPPESASNASRTLRLKFHHSNRNSTVSTRYHH